VPQVADPLPLKTFVKDSKSGIRLLLAEQERITTLRDAVSESIESCGNDCPEIQLAFGPEGGWTPEEEALWDSHGWRSVSLGPRILRAETAAIAALAITAAMLS
jgi:16S rRNA (uracil1498-N3)-methyltransferase